MITDRRRLTELGEAARQALSSPQPRVTLTVVSDGDSVPATFDAYQRTEMTAIVASPRPGGSVAGESGSTRTLDLIATQTTAIAMVRWLGLAPAWPFAIDDDAFAARPDPSTVDARLRDPSTPPPAEANAALTRVWGRPSQVVTLSATYPPMEPPDGGDDRGRRRPPALPGRRRGPADAAEASASSASCSR